MSEDHDPANDVFYDYDEALDYVHTCACVCRCQSRVPCEGDLCGMCTEACFGNEGNYL